MKLGIVIILIGVAWCVRSYLLRPPIPVITEQRQQRLLRVNDTDCIPNRHPGVLYVSLPQSPKEGERIEYIYWTTPDHGGGRPSRAREVITFTKGKWISTDSYRESDDK